MQQTRKEVSAQNHYCFNCALEIGEYVIAAKIVWEENSSMCIPLCEECFKEMELAEKTFFSDFSLN